MLHFKETVYRLEENEFMPCTKPHWILMFDPMVVLDNISMQLLCIKKCCIFIYLFSFRRS